VEEYDGMESTSFSIQFQAMLEYLRKADPMRLRDIDVVLRVRFACAGWTVLCCSRYPLQCRALST
jgi:hypothetical protein